MRILFFLILICFSKSAYAAGMPEGVYLESGGKNESLSVQKGRIDFNSAGVKYTQDLRRKQHDNFLYDNNQTAMRKKSSVSKSLEKEVLKDSYLGVSYSAAEKSGALNDSVSLYSKYQKKHFGLSAGYSQDREGFKDAGALGGTVSVSPEFKFNNHIKLKNTFSKNLSSDTNQGGAAISLTPFKDDRLNLDFGISETFENGNNPAKSQFNFGAGFKF